MLVRNITDKKLQQVLITNGYDVSEQDPDQDEPITLRNGNSEDLSVTLAELMTDYIYEGEGDL